MSQISISARHDMDLEHAQEAADELAADLAEKFDIDYGWDGDFIHFERSGADGQIEVNKDIIHVEARLGLLFGFMKTQIENEICSYLTSHFDCEIQDPSC